MSSDSEPEPSELGRREYWDATYRRELLNLDSHGDEGEIWFGEDVMETMADYTAELLAARTPDAHGQAVLDVGCGNGAFLLALAQRGFRRLTGADYSAASVQLAQRLAARRGMQGIEWRQQDILDASQSPKQTYDVVTDKGTLDAVGLSAGAAENRARYRRAMAAMLAPGGLLVLTSCNSTLQELREEFCGADAPFEYVDHVRSYPTFRFSGHEGSRVCTVAFRRRS